jgi:hypothetical protein
VTNATLDIYIRNDDSGGAVGVLDFYVYPGDGVVETTDFDSGYPNPPYTQIQSTDYIQVEHIDFTAAVNQALQSGWSHLGVRISTTTADRYWLGGSAVGLPEAILRVSQ